MQVESRQKADEDGAESGRAGSKGRRTQQKNRSRGKEGNSDWKDSKFSSRTLNNPRRNFSDSGIPSVTQASLEELKASSKGWRSIFLIPCIKIYHERRKKAMEAIKKICKAGSVICLAAAISLRNEWIAAASAMLAVIAVVIEVKNWRKKL